MNRGMKIALILAACLVVAGLILGGIALLAGGVQFGNFQIGRGSLTVRQADLVPKTYEVQGAFRSLDVRGVSGDVELRPASDGRCRVECVECDGWTHKVEVRSGTLYVERETKANVNLLLGMNGRDVIEVWLPERDYEALAVSTTSGDVRIPADFRFGVASVASTSGGTDFRAQVGGGLTAAATSGAIAVTDVSCASLSMSGTSGGLYVSGVETGGVSLSCTSGSVSLENVRASGELYVHTTSGDIRMKNVSCRALEMESSSGEKTLTDVVAQENFKSSATSGALSMTRCDAGSLHITSTSGEVEGSLLTDKIFITHTTSGDVKVPVGRSGGDCEIETTSGDVRIKIEG